MRFIRRALPLVMLCTSPLTARTRTFEPVADIGTRYDNFLLHNNGIRTNNLDTYGFRYITEDSTTYEQALSYLTEECSMKRYDADKLLVTLNKNLDKIQAKVSPLIDHDYSQDFGYESSEYSNWETGSESGYESCQNCIEPDNMATLNIYDLRLILHREISYEEAKEYLSDSCGFSPTGSDAVLVKINKSLEDG